MLLDGLTVIDRPAPGTYTYSAQMSTSTPETVCTAYQGGWRHTAAEPAGAGFLRVVISCSAATGSATALGRVIPGLPPLSTGSDWR